MSAREKVLGERDHGGTDSIEERLKQASPRELRKIATEMLRGEHSELIERRTGPAQPVERSVEPGPGDGGTTAVPPPSNDIGRTNDPRRVRELAAKITAQRKRSR